MRNTNQEILGTSENRIKSTVIEEKTTIWRYVYMKKAKSGCEFQKDKIKKGINCG